MKMIDGISQPSTLLKFTLHPANGHSDEIIRGDRRGYHSRLVGLAPRCSASYAYRVYVSFKHAVEWKFEAIAIRVFGLRWG